MKTALIVIDLQKAFYAKAPDGFDRAIGHINTLIEVFRQKGHPVVWVQHANKNVQPGQAEYAFVDGLQALEGDFHVHKSHGSAFHDGTLKTFLEEQNIHTVYLGGYAAEHCILSTARGAMDVDIRPVLVKETVVSSDMAKLSCVLDLQDNTTIKELLQSLR